MAEVKFDTQAARELLAGPTIDGVAVSLAMVGALDRIEELEACLCESEAISLHNFQRYEAAIDKCHIANMDHKIGWSDLPEEQRKVIIEVHREMLQAAGKL